MESMWKDMGTNSSWNGRINDTMVVDSIIMTICMSPFSKPFLDFDSMLQNSPSQTCLSTNVVHTFLYEMISPS